MKGWGQEIDQVGKFREEAVAKGIREIVVHRDRRCLKGRMEGVHVPGSGFGEPLVPRIMGSGVRSGHCVSEGFNSVLSMLKLNPDKPVCFLDVLLLFSL